MKAISGVLIVMDLATPALTQTPDGVALADLIADALKTNPEIAAAVQRYAAARQRPAQERSLPDPMVSTGWKSPMTTTINRIG